MIMNQLKTALLLGSLTGLIFLLGQFLGGHDGIVIAFIFALVMNGLAYFFSDRIVLSIYKARPLDKDRYGSIYAIVHDLCKDMHLPMPKLWLITTDVANAFATGRNPSHASVALTTGILTLLDEHELRGVLAHELSHIKNRDILVSTIAATFAAVIGYIANMLQHAIFWNAVMDNKKRNNNNSIAAFIIALFMPIIATLLQLAISRSREYLADETGAHACQDPLALASALEKLHNHTKQHHFDTNDATKASTAHLFIVNPLTAQGVASLFSTHPPMQERTKRLKKIFETMFLKGRV